MTTILGTLILLIGFVLGTGGVWLIALDGSWYYLPAGLGLTIAGIQVAPRRMSGAWFSAGDPIGDWVEAEAEIDELLCSGRRQSSAQNQAERIREEILCIIQRMGATAEVTGARGTDQDVYPVAGHVWRSAGDGKVKPHACGASPPERLSEDRCRNRCLQ